jgi:hypothetical protein
VSDLIVVDVGGAGGHAIGPEVVIAGAEVDYIWNKVINTFINKVLKIKLYVRVKF